MARRAPCVSWRLLWFMTLCPLLALMSLYVALIYKATHAKEAVQPLLASHHQTTHPPGMALVAQWNKTKQPGSSCAGPHFIFIKEFWVALNRHRMHELLAASQDTMSNNPCGLFRFGVTKHEWGTHNFFKQLHEMNDVTIEVYLTFGPMTMERLFYIASLQVPGAPPGIYVVSTADVAVPPVQMLARFCGNAFRPKPWYEVLVISRDDVNSTQCEVYAKRNSYDVFMGNVSMITPPVLQNLVVSPMFWGIESITAHALAGGKYKRVFQLCPYVRATHYHSSRKGQQKRIRVNHPSNNIWPFGKLGAICNMSLLCSMTGTAVVGLGACSP